MTSLPKHEADFQECYMGKRSLERPRRWWKDDKHVGDVRLRLWTAVTIVSIVHTSGDIWTWRTIVWWWYRRGKTSDSCQSSLAIPPAVTSGSKQEERVKEMINLAFEVSFSYFEVIFICRKVLWHGANDFTFPPKEGVLRFFMALKNPLAGIEPANLVSNDNHANHYTIEDDRWKDGISITFNARNSIVRISIVRT
jgi:hypothetical protein